MNLEARGKLAVPSGIRRGKFVLPDPEITDHGPWSDHYDSILKVAGRNSVWIERLRDVHGRKTISWPIVIDPERSDRFPWFVRHLRSQHFRGSPCRGRDKTSSSDVHLAHAVIGIHWSEGDNAVSGGGFAQRFGRRGDSLLSYAAHLFHDLESRTEDDFSMPANGLCKSCIGSWIRGRCVEDDIVKNESRFLLRQTIQEVNVQGAVPDIVER